MQALSDFLRHPFVAGLLPAIVVFLVIPWLLKKFRSRRMTPIATLYDRERFQELPAVALWRDKDGNGVHVELSVSNRDGGASYDIPEPQIPKFLTILDDYVSFGKSYPLTFAPKKRLAGEENIKQTGLSYELGLKGFLPLVLKALTDEFNSEVVIRFDDNGYMIPLSVFEQWVIALRALFEAYGIVPKTE
jgi:hypothetical protein